MTDCRDRSGKAAAVVGGLHSDWQKRAQAQPPGPSVAPTAASTTTTARHAGAKPWPSVATSVPAAASSTNKAATKSHAGRKSQGTDLQSDGDGADANEQVDAGGLGLDEDDDTLEAVRKDKQGSVGVKKVHKGGTKVVRLVFTLEPAAHLQFPLDGHQAEDSRHCRC